MALRAAAVMVFASTYGGGANSSAAPLSDPSCHGQAHAVGEAIGERSATLAEAMLACGDQCTFGCVHGAFRSYFSRKLTGDRVPPDVAAEIREVCATDSSIVPDFFRGNCAHSVGHALAVAASDDRVASRCAVFADAEMRFYCETGVFMQYRDAAPGARSPDRAWSASSARRGIDYCASRSEALGACLRFVWPKAADLGESRELLRVCGSLRGDSRRSCAYAAGYAARGYLRAHPDQAGRVCGAAGANDRAYCVAGLVLMKKDYAGRVAIPALCRAMEDAALRAVCEDQGARYYYRLDNPVIRSMVGAPPGG